MKADEIKVAQRTLTLPKWMMGRLAADAQSHGRTFSGEVREILFHNDAIPRWLLILGVVGQTIFSLRFLYQLFYSASRRESLLPTGFWIISLTGAILILTYGILRRDPVLILAQSFGLVTYIRNLMLIRRNRAA